MSPDKLPTAQLNIVDTDKALEEILAFASHLEARGERAWFEVWYPPPAGLTEPERLAWAFEQASTFDAVEVIDGEIRTLPPYVELLA